MTKTEWKANKSTMLFIRHLKKQGQIVDVLRKQRIMGMMLEYFTAVESEDRS